MFARSRVLPWRGWPRRQGFWRRLEETASAGNGFGYHPAHFLLKLQLGATYWVASGSPFAIKSSNPLPASKIQSGLGAERRNGSFKGTCSLKAKNSFKDTHTYREFPLKKMIDFKKLKSKTCVRESVSICIHSFSNNSFSNNSYSNNSYSNRSYSNRSLCNLSNRNFFNRNFSNRNFSNRNFSIKTIFRREFLNSLFRQLFSSPVNLEGGLCNTPLYNYLGVGQRT